MDTAEDDDSDELQAIGFMFDRSHRRTQRNFHFNHNEKDLKISIASIGSQPGHVQSGQYLWPAAEYCCKLLIEQWSILKSDYILEIGAGCGLTGLLASKLEGSVKVLFTDYDPGCIEIIKENILANSMARRLDVQNHDEQSLLRSKMTDVSQVCACEAIQYKWGTDVQELLQSIYVDDSKIHKANENRFGLIIGTDLLYCKEVAYPLFYSIKCLLKRTTGVFVLVSSFNTGEDVKKEVERSLQLFDMTVEEISSLNPEINTLQVQYFRLSSKI